MAAVIHGGMQGMCSEAFGWDICSSGGCKMERGAGVVVAAPSPISPLKEALRLSVIHSVPGAQCFLFFF